MSKNAGETAPGRRADGVLLMGANGTGRKPPKQRKGSTRGRRKAGCAARSEGALWCLTSGERSADIARKRARAGVRGVAS